jgi:long-chain acyl-CoA synthetase
VVVPDEDVLRSKGIVNVKELMRFEIEGRAVSLPAYKRILSYDISMEPLPRTTTGKIRRHEVQRRVRDRAANVADGEQNTRPLSDADAAWVSDPAHRDALTVVAARLARASVRPDLNLELDLGLDSMERVELLTALEQRQGTRVAPDVRATIFTVRQLIDAVERGAADLSAANAGAAENGAARVATVRADEADSGLGQWDTLLNQPPSQDVMDVLARPRRLRTLSMFAIVRITARVVRIFIRFRCIGLDRLPASGPYILSPNHQAYVDPFLLAAALPYRAFKDLFFVGAAEYFETPFTRWFARTINLIPVDPDANLVTAMQAGAAGLRLGKILVLFPEGERSIDGELKKFRKGAPILSAHLEAPIVPVALDGLFEIWPRGRSLQWSLLKPWHRAPVTYEIGQPLKTTRGDYAEGTARLRAAVEQLLAHIRQRA